MSGLFVYPVKSCRGIAVSRSSLDACGLSYDRRFMVVNERGVFHTQRDLPQMARITTTLTDGTVQLAVDDDRIVVIADDARDPLDVVVWKDRVRARSVSATVDAWLSDKLGARVRLAHIPDDVIRSIDPHYGDGRTGFADGFPLLVVGQASLDDLNARLAQPVPMSRFRPNLVVSGAPAFAEDGWRELRIGDVRLRIVKPCARCSIVTTDPLTGARGVEPLRTLATYRTVGSEVMFGQNVVHLGTGEIAVGDRVEVSS